MNVDHRDAGPQSIMYRASGAKYDLAFRASFWLMALNHASAVWIGDASGAASWVADDAAAVHPHAKVAATTHTETLEPIAFKRRRK